MPESPDAARLQQIRAAVTETGWWRMTRPDIELLVAEINRLEALVEAHKRVELRLAREQMVAPAQPRRRRQLKETPSA